MFFGNSVKQIGGYSGQARLGQAVAHGLDKLIYATTVLTYYHRWEGTGAAGGAGVDIHILAVY